MKQVKNNQQIYELAKVLQFEDGKIAGLMVQQGEANCDKILQSYHAGYFQAINDLMREWNQGCSCGEKSIGQTWCCNLCGLPYGPLNSELLNTNNLLDKPEIKDDTEEGIEYYPSTENEQYTIKITPQKCIEFFHNALCNGITYIEGYGLSLDYDHSAYQLAKDKLRSNEESDCWEDILMQILKDGGKLTLIDEECGGLYTKSITINDVINKMEKVPLNFLMQMINGEDDAETADIIIQTIFFNEIIFG
jgi:hypothetical protein